MDKREIAWKCWAELIKEIDKRCYMPHDKLLIRDGCGGDFVNIIEKYI